MKKYLIGSLMAVAAVACTSVSDKTTLQGKFSGADVPEEISIVIPDVIDTTVALKNAAFKIEIPVEKASLGHIMAGHARGSFISDGTALTVSLADGALEIKSAKPAVSLTEKLNSFDSEAQAMVAEYRTGMAAIADSTGLSADQIDSLQEEFYNTFFEKFKKLNNDVIDANKDNILSLYALQNVYSEMSDDTLEAVLTSIDSNVVEKNDVAKAMLGGVTARKNTAEGMKFTDFSVMQPDGKEAKLSDYVGNGKYVLVDFWASWCRPCKHEIPNVKAVYDKYHGKDFDVLSVAVWEKTARESLDTAKAYGVNWNQIVDAKNVPTDIYGIMGIPHIILFGPDGTIIKRGLYGESIEEEVSKYVK